MKIVSCVFLGLFCLPLAAAQAYPVTGADSMALSFVHLSLGDPGLAGDCTVLETSSPGGAASRFDALLVDCQGRAAGSLVTDQDTVILTATGTNPALSLSYADINANGRYDSGDAVYLDTDPAAGLTASTSATAFTIRVTQAMANAAGTYVHSGDSDMQAFGSATTPFPTPSVTWTDPDVSVSFTPGDTLYILTQNGPGFPAGSLVPAGSIRMTPTSGSGGTISSATTSAAPSTSTTTQSATTAPTANATASSSPGSHSFASNSGVTVPSATGAGASRPGTGTLSIPLPVSAALGVLLALLLARRRLL